jgi:hypothetical protein
MMDSRFIGMGLALGVVIGAVTDHMGLGIALGIVFGAVLGAAKAKRDVPPDA